MDDDNEHGRPGAPFEALAGLPSPWEDLVAQRRSPESDGAKVLALRLSQAPPECVVQETFDAVELFAGVPETPGPSSRRGDMELHQWQQKIEAILHLCVTQAENSTDQAVPIAILSRDLFDSLNVRRRALFVSQAPGGAKGILDKIRVGPQLLSTDEEKRMVATMETRGRSRGGGYRGRSGGFSSGYSFRGRGRSNYQNWAPANEARDRTRSASPGKGKGKGKGRGGRGRGRGSF
jgi:hypothetical protein